MSKHIRELSSAKWRKAVFHPFLIDLIPVLHILASNPGQASFSDAFILILISLGFTLVAFVALLMILKNSEAAGLIVSLFLVLFFSFGHVVDFTPGSKMLDLLFFAFCAALVPGVFLLIKILFFTYGRFIESLGGSTAVRVVVAVAYVAVLGLVRRLIICGGQQSSETGEARCSAYAGRLGDLALA